MTDSLRSIRSVLLSVLLLLAGHGLQLTLLPLQAQALGWPSHLVGITGSAYYVGFLAGCLLVGTIVRRVGHIRAFLVFVALAALAINLAGSVPAFIAWLVLRAVNGCAMAVLYTVVESWLNERSSDAHRGSLLAVYTVLSLGAMATGQLFIDQLSFETLFKIAFALVIAAALPIGLTRNEQPAVAANTSTDWRTAYRASHVGIVGAALSGIVVGMTWTVGAINAADVSGSTEAGARFVIFAIAGGLIAQFPAGRLSDFVDRRGVIAALAGIGLAGALLPIFWLDTQALNVSTFLLGAGAMPMYSICIAHASDNASGRFLAIATSMLMASSLGSVMGPILFSVIEAGSPGNGFTITVSIAFGTCLGWTVARILRHKVSRDHFEPYQPLPKTTPEVVTLDPRNQLDELNDPTPRLITDEEALFGGERGTPVVTSLQPTPASRRLRDENAKRTTAPTTADTRA